MAVFPHKLECYLARVSLTLKLSQARIKPSSFRFHPFASQRTLKTSEQNGGPGTEGDPDAGDYDYPATRAGHVKRSGHCVCYPERCRSEHRESGDFYEPRKGRPSSVDDCPRAGAPKQSRSEALLWGYDPDKRHFEEHIGGSGGSNGR